jgi:hypothetical protein
MPEGPVIIIRSQQVRDHRAREAVMAKITEHEAAAAALAVTQSPLLAASSSNVPDLDQARTRRASR